MKRAIYCVSLVTFFSQIMGLSVFAQNRSISPGMSTCKDVERIYGGVACGRQSISYEFVNKILTFTFVKNSCNPLWPFEEYALPVGTVVKSFVMFRDPRPHSTKELGINLRTFQKRQSDDQLGLYEYSDSKRGLVMVASDLGIVDNISHIIPPSFDEYRCTGLDTDKDRNTGQGMLPRKIIEFSPSSHLDPKSGLELVVREFSVESEAGPTPAKEIFLLYYGGKQSCSDEPLNWLREATNYLVTQGISPLHIKTIRAGYRQSPIVQAYIRLPGERIPRISPDLHPQDVVAGNCGK